MPHRATLGSVVIDDGARVFVEGFETLADGLGVVVDTSGSQAASHQPLGHGLVADFEVEHLSARPNFRLELDALRHFARVAVDQEAF